MITALLISHLLFFPSPIYRDPSGAQEIALTQWGEAWLGVVPIQQLHSKDCSIAVTEMILQYYGQDASGLHDEMRGNIPESDGINSGVIIDTLRMRDLSAEWKILYPFEFTRFVKAEIQAERPVIAIMKSGKGYHVVLIVGIDNKRIWYINPTRGEVMSREIKDFTRQALTDWGIYAIQILPIETN